MKQLIELYDRITTPLCEWIRRVDWFAPLAVRLYLAPVLIIAGVSKFQAFDNTAYWFGEVLGMPLPELMVFLAASTELVGGLLLIIGLAVRWIAVPLAFTMIVAATTAHIENGWFAIAPSNPDTSAAKVLATIGIPAAQRSLDNSVAVGQRLEAARSILREHGNYAWLTEKGSFVVLNNGIEFSVTYFLMLITLIYLGGGRWVSVDYYLAQYIRNKL